MKIFLFIIGSLILAFFAQDAWSHDHHHETTLTNVNRGTKVNVSSQALSIATAQIHPELGTNKLQLGFGIASHNGTAFAVGIHKQVKIGKKNALFGGTISTGNNETIIGAGVNIKL